jgi:hypothetical protein
VQPDPNVVPTPTSPPAITNWNNAVGEKTYTLSNG